MIPMIILAIENEDDRAFMAQLYEDYNRLMYSELHKLISDDWAVEDVLQDSLERLIDKIETLRKLDKRRLINYLITTVRNQAKNYYRASSKASFSSLDDEGSPLYGTMPDDDNIEDQLFQKEQLKRLSGIWPQLSDNARELLERKYILGQKDEEIAKAFHIKPSSVRMKMTRARQEAFDLMQD